MDEPNEAILLIRAYSKMVELKEEREWRQLTNVVNVRNTIDQIIWVVFGIFWTVNTLLLIALFSGGTLPNSTVGLVLSGTGLVFCIVWYRIQICVFGYFDYYSAITQDIEDSLQVDRKMAISKCRNTSTSNQHLSSSLRITFYMKGCFWVATVVWFVALVLFLIH